jgi:flotillin
MIDFELTKQRIAVIPETLEQAMKPIEKISDIRIFSAGSLLGAMGNGNGADGANGGGPIADLSSQLLSYGAQKPILDAILSQAGFAGSSPIDALLNGTQHPTLPAQKIEAPAKP